MNVTEIRFRCAFSALREVGYAGLDAADRAICDAFDKGALTITDASSFRPIRHPEFFGDPADVEFEPRDHNDADGVHTMRDFQ